MKICVTVMMSPIWSAYLQTFLITLVNYDNVNKDANFYHSGHRTVSLDLLYGGT